LPTVVHVGKPPGELHELARVDARLARLPAIDRALGEAWHAGVLNVSQAQARVSLLLAAGSERFHAAWISRVGEVTVRRLEDDVGHGLAMGALDPALLPELPKLMDPAGSAADRPANPAGVQTGARPTHADTDVWSANLPTNVARLFRACLSPVARRLETGPGAALEAVIDHAVATGGRRRRASTASSSATAGGSRCAPQSGLCKGTPSGQRPGANAFSSGRSQTDWVRGSSQR
jgi:hypothetical protein